MRCPLSVASSGCLGADWVPGPLAAAPVTAGAAYLGVQRIQRPGGQPRGHRRLEAVDVLADLAQRLGAQRVVALPALLLDLEQACLGEQPQVPADRRSGDRLPGGQVDDPHRLGRDGGEQLPAYGIGERREDIHQQKRNQSVTNAQATP